MTCFSAAKVQQLFQKLGWPFEFSQTELAEWDTTDVVGYPAEALAFPTPRSNQGLNILNLRRIAGTDPARQPSFFDHPWYLDEPFGQIDCPAGWHVIRSSVLPDSIGQPHDYLNSLPMAIEVILLLFLQYAATGEQLLLKKHTWCSDITTLGQFVTVGAFGRNGVFISGHPGNYYSRGLGVCAKYL